MDEIIYCLKKKIKIFIMVLFKKLCCGNFNFSWKVVVERANTYIVIYVIIGKELLYIN